MHVTQDFEKRDAEFKRHNKSKFDIHKYGPLCFFYSVQPELNLDILYHARVDDMCS